MKTFILIFLLFYFAVNLVKELCVWIKAIAKLPETSNKDYWLCVLRVMITVAAGWFFIALVNNWVR